ncbi:hypothetical protein RJ640_014942 [Escallonia rubra]|uniref:Large ribosomal subunit protein bL33c n=1 Tax=Escallonia rubra TaxID=112253 RepID=A0AA88SNW6_9ASTE|nr:hypothetical protein RJ640_014942 [Escallonia rubra]
MSWRSHNWLGKIGSLLLTWRIFRRRSRSGKASWGAEGKRLDRGLAGGKKQFLSKGGHLSSLPTCVLGIKRLRTFDTCLLGEWLWRFTVERDALWKTAKDAAGDLAALVETLLGVEIVLLALEEGDVLAPAPAGYRVCGDFIDPFDCLLSGMGEKKKSALQLCRLVSAAGTGFFYTKWKNPKKITWKLEFRKYDPRVNRHVLFTEAKK